MLDKEIIERGMNYITVNDMIYFEVKDLKEKTNDLLGRETKVILIKSIPYILAKDIRIKTEFDYLMEKTFNSNLNKQS